MRHEEAVLTYSDSASPGTVQSLNWSLSWFERRARIIIIRSSFIFKIKKRVLKNAEKVVINPLWTRNNEL